jgi:hypothetical protein
MEKAILSETSYRSTIYEFEDGEANLGSPRSIDIKTRTERRGAQSR